MIVVNLDRVTVTYGSEPVFENISWEIQDDRCVGLIGPNGCGKSTLLGLTAGERESNTGFIVRRKELTIGYLHQEPQFESRHTVFEEVLSAATQVSEVEVELGRIEIQLENPPVYSNQK